MVVLCPKSSGKLISDHSNHVRVSQDGIANLGNMVLKAVGDGLVLKSEFHNVDCHPRSTDPWAIDWIFLVDTLNFCFWNPTLDDGLKQWAVEGEVGYFALCRAINRAMRENYDVLSPKYLSTITLADLETILRPDPNCYKIPLLEQRLESLHEIGTILSNKFNNTFKTCLQQANNSAIELLQIIIDNFPNFRDESKFRDNSVSFYKRAQILVGDIWSCYQCDKNSEFGKLAQFDDIDQITMFADYRVPQILKHFGVLEYSEELCGVLAKEEILSPGSWYEIEIRGCSIDAIEQLKEWIQKRQPEVGKKLNSILLDQYLWELRRKINHELVNVPYHRVVSIYY